MQPTQTNPLDHLLTSLRAYGVRKITIEFSDSGAPEISETKEIKLQATKEAPKLPEEMLSGEF